MSDANPFAAPQIVDPVSERYSHGAPQGFPGLWREGNLLVLHKAAPLPDICLKSNQPAIRRLRRNLRWHHPALFLTFFVNLLLYAIIALLVAKKATLDIPLTEAWHRRRTLRMAIASGAVLLCGMQSVLGLGFLTFDLNGGVVLLVGGILGMLTAVIGGLVGSQLVAPSRITDDHVWLRGVHPEYLDRLPPWPYNI